MLRNGGGFAALQRRRLVLPTDEFFPQQGRRDHAFARAVFEQVKEHAGLADCPCRVEPQDSEPELLHAIAIFAALRGDAIRDVQAHLKPSLAVLCERACASVAARGERLRALREIEPVRPGRAERGQQ